MFTLIRHILTLFVILYCTSIQVKVMCIIQHGFHSIWASEIREGCTLAQIITTSYRRAKFDLVLSFNDHRVPVSCSKRFLSPTVANAGTEDRSYGNAILSPPPPSHTKQSQHNAKALY
jgi:hypothetical protein